MKLHPRTLASFEDEMRKIAAAGFMSNLGSRIITYGGKQLRGAGSWAAKQPGNIWEAAKAHARPIHGLKEGWKFSWDPETGGGWLGRGLFLGGTALSGASAIPKEDPLGRGESRLTRAARFLGGTTTGLIASKHGFVPSLLYGAAGDVAGGYAGRAIDRMRGVKTPKKPNVGPTLKDSRNAMVQQAVMPEAKPPFPAEQGT